MANCTVSLLYPSGRISPSYVWVCVCISSHHNYLGVYDANVGSISGNTTAVKDY